MGYTHYWKSTRPFTDCEWSGFTRTVRSIINHARRDGIGVAGWDGSGPPQIDSEAVRFNGRGPDDFETFSIHRALQDFEFCKTGRRPYDAVAVAVLIAAARHNPGFSWSSDGSAEYGDFDAGTDLYNRATAKRINKRAA